MNLSQTRWMALVIAAFIARTASVSGQTVKVAWTDARVSSMLKALQSVDRSSLGFSTLAKTGDVYLDYGRAGYDVALHIDRPPVFRMISFTGSTNQYKWVGEYEIHLAPGDYMRQDRSFRDGFIIEYQKRPLRPEVATNTLSITYTGDDPRFSGRTNIGLSEVKAAIEEWETPGKKRR